VDVVRLEEGLWRWTVPLAGRASVYAEIGGAIALVDPAVPQDPDEETRFWRALDRDVERLGLPHVLLTSDRDARDAAAVVDRYPGARVWRPGGGGEAPPPGVTALPGPVAGSVLLWIEQYGALVAGPPARLALTTAA